MKTVYIEDSFDKKAFVKAISSFPKYGFAEYTSESYYPCQNGSSCCDNDYCRCGQITNTEVLSVNDQQIIDYFIKKVKDPINAYCVDRLIRTSSLLNPKCWAVEVSGGYYGEEIGGVHPLPKVLEDFQRIVESFLYKSDLQKVKDLLIQEYGFLLPALENTKNVSVVRVTVGDVKIPNMDYSRKINQKVVDSYKDFNLPRAVCQKLNSDEYKLVDGYHRMVSALKFKKRKIDIIVME